MMMQSLWSHRIHYYRSFFIYKTHALITAAYWIFMALQFVMPSDFIYSLWFYLVLCIPCIVMCVQERAWMREVLSHPVMGWIAALFAYTLLHALFLTDERLGADNTIRHTLFTAIFVVTTVLAFRIPEMLLAKILTYMLYFITIVGIAVIAWHIGYVGMTRRLEGFGLADHAILGANLFAVVALSGCYIFHPSCPSGRHVFLPILACTVISILILFTQSRGPLISFTISVALILVLTRNILPVLFAIVLVCLIGADFIYYTTHYSAILPFEQFYDAIIHLRNRPSHRIDIWNMAWGLIQQHPWFGYGMQEPFSYGYGGVNPHNIFLSAFFYTGVFGVILLLGAVITAFVMAARRCSTPKGLLCLVLVVHAVLACMTDQGQFVQSPDPLWTIFWLPLGATIALIRSTPVRRIIKT